MPQEEVGDTVFRLSPQMSVSTISDALEPSCPPLSQVAIDPAQGSCNNHDQSLFAEEMNAVHCVCKTHKELESGASGLARGRFAPQSLQLWGGSFWIWRGLRTSWEVLLFTQHTAEKEWKVPRTICKDLF